MRLAGRRALVVGLGKSGVAAARLLATYGDEAMRVAFARGVAEHAIGAEYIAHFLADAVTGAGAGAGDWHLEYRDRWHRLYVEGQLALAEGL